jgi:hypothetical protein
VHYKDLIADPIGVVRKLYAGFGWAVSAEFEAAMAACVAPPFGGVFKFRRHPFPCGIFSHCFG